MTGAPTGESIPRRFTVLIADDDTSLRGLLRATFSATPIALIEAENGTEALQLFRAYHPRILVLDVLMPGLSGLEVLRLVRSDATLPRPYVILLTARTGEAEVAAGLAAGADAYMTKPFSPVQLLNAVYSALDEVPGT